MTPATVRARFTSPIKRMGGKTYLAARIVRLMAPHELYVEPYAGGLAVLFRKPRSAHEVIGDRDPDLVTFWDTLARDRAGGFRQFVRLLAYNESTFAWAKGYHDQHKGEPFLHGDRLRAAAFLVVNRMSRSALGRDFAWSARRRRGMPEQLAAWGSMQANLDAAYDRLRTVGVACGPALDLIRAHDGPETLFYLDPPYPHETRTVVDLYEYEMTTADHRALLRFLVDELRGKCLLSSYPNALYDQWLGGAGWDHVEWDMANHAGQNGVKQRRTEVVWANYDLG